MIRNLLLLVCLCAWLPAAAHPYAVEQIENVQSADRTRFTSNPDGILSQAAVARIDSICYGLRQRGAAQVAVVAVDAIAGGDPFTFAYELFSKWGVGRREDSNGVGILLVREQREIRFVTGRGVEGVLPDALCKRIQTNYMLPAFREGDYDRGMVRGVEAVAAVLAGSELETGVHALVGDRADRRRMRRRAAGGRRAYAALSALQAVVRAAVAGRADRAACRGVAHGRTDARLPPLRRDDPASPQGSRRQRHRRPRRRNVDRRPGSLRRRFRRRTCGRRLRGRQLRRRRCRFEMVKSKKAAGRLVTLSVRPY